MDSLPPPRLDLLIHSPAPSAYLPVLNQLLEPSPPLSTLLAPQLHSRIASLPPADKPKTYHELLNLAQECMDAWSVEDQADFLAAHPRIGETKNLSKASEGEQAPKAGAGTTPGEVLKRLQVRVFPAAFLESNRAAAFDLPNSPNFSSATSSRGRLSQNLNSLYEQAFPNLRYITFVNGQTRAEIVPELESLLCLSLPPPSPSTAEPKLGILRSQIRVSPAGSGPWRAELKRGLQAMWDIAHSRVDKW
ncbi:hypothetical protein JCM11641_007970 [Rhodosporidiobolus odoratus]